MEVVGRGDVDHVDVVGLDRRVAGGEGPLGVPLGGRALARCGGRSGHANQPGAASARAGVQPAD